MLEERLRERMLVLLSPSVESIMEGPLPQRATFPCITFQRVATMPIYTHTGRLDIYPTRFQFNCWADSPDGAHVVAASVIETLPQFDLTIPPDSPEPVLVRSPNKFLMHFPVWEPEPEPMISRDIVDCLIYYRET